MIHHEAFLNAPHGKTFQARLYYNREATAFRQTTMHAHPPMEISIPGRDGVYIVGEKEIPFEAGDVFLFRSSEKHGISQLHGDGDALCLGFHFFPDTFWTSFEQELVPEFIAAFSPDRGGFQNRLPGGSPEAEAILRILRHIETEFDAQQPHYQVAIRANIPLLMLQLLRAFPLEEKQRRQENSPHLSQITAVMQYIDEHYAQKLSLAELGEVAHMSPSYLSHIFSKATGFSLWDYIIARRIEQAKHLLLSTDRKILDIAFECGFQNSVHFHKCFRSQTGLTPGEYREK